MKKKISILTAILAVLCMSISVQAETEVIRLTDNGYMDILPAVNGNYVVWQGYKDGDWEVFLYDIAAAETTQISDNDYDDIAARTDGNHVVWLGMNARGGNIFLYDIPTGQTTGQTTQVTDTGKIKSWPQIGDGRIVWSSQEVADSVLPGEIELYNIAADQPTTTTISASVDPDGDLDDHSPLIGNNQVVWVQTGLYENVRASSNRPANNMSKCRTSDSNKNCGYKNTLFIHDLTTRATYPAPDDFTIDFGPTRSGNLSITTKFDGNDREIFLNHLGLRRNTQITDNDVEEKHPAIHGNHLVWVAGQGAEQEIYLGIYQGSFYSQPW